MTGPPVTPGGDVPALVEHLFRRNAGRLVAALTGAFGPAHVDLAEEVVQEAMLRALQTWPYRGIPRDPAAWLHRVARNRALDRLRRTGRWEAELPSGGVEAATRRLEGWDPVEAPDEVPGGDDELALVFLCCHPDLSPDARVALTLKVAVGLSVEEIAAAFLTAPATVAQRIVRAKQTLREGGTRFEVPGPAGIEARLPAVAKVVYLTFNEGYAAHDGDALVRRELCGEAIRLGRILAEHPATARPETHALLALMLIQASRLDSRTDAAGGIVLLEEQDRSRWNRPLLQEGMVHLDRASRGRRLTAYHLEAGIAAAHAVAPTPEATDWRRILTYYDMLLELRASPVVELNRAVALAMVEGPERGLDAVDGLEGRKELARYHLLPAVRASLLERLGRREEAAVQYRRAYMLARSVPARRFLEGRLTRLNLPAGPASDAPPAPGTPPGLTTVDR